MFAAFLITSICSMVLLGLTVHFKWEADRQERIYQSAHMRYQVMNKFYDDEVLHLKNQMDARLEMAHQRIKALKLERDFLFRSLRVIKCLHADGSYSEIANVVNIEIDANLSARWDGDK